MSALIGHADGQGHQLAERYGGLINHEGELWRAKRQAARRPGGGLISTATVLLSGLGLGLLAVSVAAQYAYILRERHQPAVSMVEAAALDLGMIIFSLLALGLARAGQSAKIERGLIIACAGASALMNAAAANAGSPRSLMAWIMPPVFLAIVVDRVVVTIRRHVLGGQLPAAGEPAVPATAAREPAQPPPVIEPGLSVRQRLIRAYDALEGADPRHGDKSQLSPLARELAAQVGTRWSSARSVLYRHVNGKGA